MKKFILPYLISFIICLFGFFSILSRNIVHAEILGSQESCHIENEEIAISAIPNTKCFDCTCKKGFVECKKRKCPNIAGCYIFEKKYQDQECCKKCKGCTKNNVYYDSHTEWTETSDPCKLFKCIAGIITQSHIHCYIPCINPISPASGICCPTCADCHINGKKVLKEIQIMSEKDPCVVCNCTFGKLSCIKKTCPVLNCPESKIFNNFEECCPQCLGSGKFIDPPKTACLLGTLIYQSGEKFNLDDCIHCNCQNSTIYCEEISCPILKCTREHQKILPGKCCTQCSNNENEINDIANYINNKNNNQRVDEYYNKNLIQESKSKNESTCTYAENIYDNGEVWNSTTCETCICVKSKMNCSTIMCPSISCHRNSILKMLRGQCCPQCIESYGVCTIFGGVYFRTFDGKMYSFLGSCKYQLVSDCSNGSFNIMLENFVLENASTIKGLSLSISNIKVDIKQNRNIKVNKKLVYLPYRIRNKIDIIKVKENILISSKIGIKINWNFMGFIEILLSKNYQKKVCGLCGNFNSIINDDLTTREGILVENPVMFAESWTVNLCSHTKKYGIHGYNSFINRRLCNYIKGSIFEKCLRKINVTSYYEKCLKDINFCMPDNLQCHCESFTNYIRDCRRLGILLPRWRKSVGC